jgi:hypothetical protein
MEVQPTTPTAGTAPHTTDPTFEQLRAAWAVRLPPGDAVEELALDSLVAAQWRRWRLDALESRLLEAILKGETREGLPSLEAVCRYAGRLAKDLELARERLNRLRRERLDRRSARDAFRAAAEPASWPTAAAEPAAASWHEAPEPPQASAAEPDPGPGDAPDRQAPPEPEAGAPTLPPAASAAIDAAVAELLADLVGGGSKAPARAPGAARASALLGSTGLAA